MAHEYTHAVVSSETNLGATGIDGAINEGYADIFSILSQEYFAVEKGYSFSHNWTICEDSVGDERFIYDPHKGSNPTIYKDDRYYREDGSDYGAHNNSTIVSHLCYKMCNLIKEPLELKTCIDLWYTSLILGYGNNQKDFRNLYRNLITAASILNIDNNQLKEIKAEARLSFSIDEDLNDNTISRVEWKNIYDNDYGIIEGTVKSNKNIYLNNVKVSLYGVDYHFDHPIECLTDGNGYFRIDNLPVGRYIVMFSKYNYDVYKMQIELGYREYFDDSIENNSDEYMYAYCTVIMCSKNINSEVKRNLYIETIGKEIPDSCCLNLRNSSGDIIDSQMMNDEGVYCFKDINNGIYSLEFFDKEYFDHALILEISSNINDFFYNIVLPGKETEICLDIKSEISNYYIDDIQVTVHKYYNNELVQVYSDTINDVGYCMKLGSGHYRIAIKKICHMTRIVDLIIDETGSIIINGENNENHIINIILKEAVEDDELLYGFVWRGNPPIIENTLEISYLTEYGERYVFYIDSFENVIGRPIVNTVNDEGSVIFYSISLSIDVFDSIFPGHSDCLGIMKSFDGQNLLEQKYVDEYCLGGLSW